MSLESGLPLVYAKFARRVTCTALLLVFSFGLHAQDWRITYPKRTKPTPVQKLNQDGVKALRHKHYDRAKQLFYKAYLLDPNDPFTLNNLGYISELEGNVDRAQRYYDLASQFQSNATVYISTDKHFVGKTVASVAGHAPGSGLHVNQLNVAAIGLLMHDRAPEADLLLQKALALQPNDAFTLNNMGFTKEKEGELQDAFDFYAKAAGLGSKQKIVVTANRDWRGKGISNIAERNAEKVRKEMEKSQDLAARVALLNLRGVSALNRNQPDLAVQYFQEAYHLDPTDSFALNNMGYLAEMRGDKETATSFYEQAQQADGAKRVVTVATNKAAQGKQLQRVADNSDQKVTNQLAIERAIRREQVGEPTLKQRGEAAPAPASPSSPLQPPPN